VRGARGNSRLYRDPNPMAETSDIEIRQLFEMEDFT
jgi:hypothetical protein